MRTSALNFSKNYEWFEKPYQKLERVFHQVSKHLEVGQKNSAAPRFFNPLLGVWISWWNTLSRVWYITPKCYLAMSISKYFLHLMLECWAESVLKCQDTCIWLWYISKICYVDADIIFYSINFHKTKEKFIELDLIELLSCTIFSWLSGPVLTTWGSQTQHSF